jgi:hypothetical protein
MVFTREEIAKNSVSITEIKKLKCFVEIFYLNIVMLRFNRRMSSGHVQHPF